MLGEDVILDVENGAATITLNQPDRLNPLSDGIKNGIAEALDGIDERDDIRCVVFEGAGRAFSAGGDIKGMQDRDEEDRVGHRRAQGIVDSCEQIAVRVYNFELPTIAKIDGYCVGAGIGIAMACDILLASERSQFGLAFRNIGLTLDFATSLFVVRAVGPYVAKELALTGDLFSAEIAEDLGLINHAYSDDEFEAEADDFVERIASGPTVALHYSIRNIDRAWNGSIREAIEREASAQAMVGQTQDHQEGIDAFGEDRDASFDGR